jgi:hypothetical protein
LLLSVRSGAITDQDRAETFLRARTGRFFCAACIAQEIEVTAAKGRTLLWNLRAVRSYEMRLTLCVRCRRGKRAIRHVAKVLVAEAKRDVVAFLVRNAGIPICDPCLAFVTERRLRDVERALDELEPFAEFRRHEKVCLVCSLTTPVTAAVIDESGPVLTVTKYHDDWRLDLLSYPIAAGWRPLVVIKGPPGRTLTDVPSLLSEAFPSKIAADEHALDVASKWVCKTDRGRITGRSEQR